MPTGEQQRDPSARPGQPAYQSAVGIPRQGAAVNPTRRPLQRRWLTYGIMFTGFFLSWAMLSFFYGASFDVTVVLLAAVFAAIPLLVVVPTYLWLDRYEVEPLRFKLFAFFWGALCAPVGALFLNTGIERAIAASTGEDGASVVGAVLVAPPVEEGLKGLAILLIVLLRRREFDGVIDGIVYAGLAASGFAFSENILYLGRSYLVGGQDSLNHLFILRGVMGPFAHPLFTACTGVGLGLAVTVMRTPLTRILAGLGGYVCAMLLHGIWNLSAVLNMHLAVYFFFQVPLFLAFIAMVVFLRYREGRLIRTHLSPYADAGWLTHADVAMLASLGGRRRARTWARAQGGAGALAAMRAFQDGASDLALLRSRMARGTAEAGAAERERVLLEAMVVSRRGFISTPVG